MEKTSKWAQRTIIAVLAGTLLLPSFAFASSNSVVDPTTLIAQLQAQVKLLEAELAALVGAQQSVVTATTPTVNQVQVSVANAASTQEGNLGNYNFTLNVENNATTTLYIPLTTNTSSTGIPGVVYAIQGDSFSGSQSATTTCPSYISLSMGWATVNNLQTKAQGSFCTISPGQTQQIKTTIALSPASSGNYAVQVSGINYTFSKQPTTSAAYGNISLGNAANTNPVYIAPSIVATSTAISNSICGLGYTVGNKVNTPYGVGTQCLPDTSSSFYRTTYPHPTTYTVGAGWACYTSYTDCSFGG